MFKQHNYQFGLATDGWIAIEPTDAEVVEKVYTKNIREGEEKLMLAVLEEAVQCFQDYVLSTRPREQRLFQEAEEWICETDSDYIFSFKFICESLGLHPDHIRHGLMTWKDAKLKIDSVEAKIEPCRKLLKTQYMGKPGRVAKAG